MSRTTYTLAALCFAAVFALPAQADQASYLTQESAEDARFVLQLQAKNGNSKILHYCAPCRNGKMEREAISSVTVKPTPTAGYWQVHVNDKSIDLAYVYYRNPDAGKRWTNLARVVGVDVEDVPTYLPDIIGK